MSENKNTGVESPKWLNSEPEFQYAEHDCPCCGKIFLEAIYAKGCDFENYFLVFKINNKIHKIKNSLKNWTTEKPEDSENSIVSCEWSKD